ncbi:MFS transporter [soil metagenome]
MGLFFAGYFSINGVAVPFFPVWLAERGFSEVEIANIIAIPMAVRVLLTPLGGAVADRMPSRRFAARMFMVPAAFILLGAWWQTGYWPIMLLTGGAFLLWQLGLPAGEALALTGLRRFGLDYGRMRLWGSVAFITINLTSGALLTVMPRESIFWFILAGFVAAAAVTFSLPRTPPAIRALDDAARPARGPAWGALAQPAFLALAFAAGLIGASHAVFYSFGSLFLEKLGYNTVEIGGFWAVSLGCEVTFFAFSTAIYRRIGAYPMVALGAVAAMLRWLVFGLDFGTPGFVFAQSLHAFSFASVFLGTQHAVARAVPEQYAASAQGLVFMIGGLTMAGMTALAGPLYQAYGGQAFYAMIVPPVLALAILALARRLVPPE